MSDTNPIRVVDYRQIDDDRGLCMAGATNPDDPRCRGAAKAEIHVYTQNDSTFFPGVQHDTLLLCGKHAEKWQYAGDSFLSQFHKRHIASEAVIDE